MASDADSIFQNCKARGNFHFEKGEYLDAVQCYTECLKVHQKAVIYTNRALCYLKLLRPRDALEDCDKALVQEPCSIKALYRKATAYKDLENYSDSLWNLKVVLAANPGNTAADKEYISVIELWKKQNFNTSHNTTKTGEKFEFSVILTCTSNQLTTKKIVSSRKAVDTILDIKLLIERQLSIPVSAQILEYESHVFDDSTSVKSLPIQSGDTVHIKYSSEADCKAVEEAAVWVFELVYHLMKECPSVDSRADSTLDHLITMGINTNLPTAKYFDDILDPRCCANMHHFVRHWGLNVMLEILSRIQTVPWTKRLLKLKLVELIILCIMQKFILHYSPLILACRGLECCMISLLHVHVEKHHYIADVLSPLQQRYDDLLALVMVRSVVVLCGLCEHSDSRLEIVANPSALQQVLNISMAVPTERQIQEVGVLAPQVGVALLLGISYSVATHKHLANQFLIETVIEVSNMERPWCSGDSSKNVLLIKYLAAMFLAQLVLLSLKEISPVLYLPILSLMKEFLLIPNYVEVMMLELKKTFVWTTFVPYVRLLYTPDEELGKGEKGKEEVEEEGDKRAFCVSTMKLCSQEIVLLGLHSMLMRENHCRVLLSEGLIDYIVCLPWHVPQALRSRATPLAPLLSSVGNIALCPPRLVSLAKAKLAKMHFGLEFVLHMPVSNIVEKMFQK